MSKEAINQALCKKCGNVIDYCEEDTFWDYSSIGSDYKLVKCPECGSPIVLKCEVNRTLYINDDKRYY